MSYCCLIPLYRYQVDYTIASGEPFTDFDRFVLRAIRETGDLTLEQLERRLCLPPRLLIETVVGMGKRGYLGLSGGSQPSLRVTALGRRMLSEARPPISKKLQHKSGDIFVERLTGRVLLKRHLTYATRRSLASRNIADTAVIIESELRVAAPDYGQVHAMLSSHLGSREWVDFLVMAQAAVSEPHFLPVDADPVSDVVINLPVSWYHLKEQVLRELKARLKANPEIAESSYFRRAPKAFELRGEGDRHREIGWHYTIIDVERQLMFGNRQHEAYLEEVLTKQAGSGSYSLITSAFLDTRQLEPKIRGWILGAVGRGAHVEILWGYEAYDENRKQDGAIQWLKELQIEASQLPGEGDFIFNERRTGSHAKLIVHRGATSSACIGSYNWLSSRAVSTTDEADASNVSLIINTPGLVAELCLSVASLWESAAEREFLPPIQHWRAFGQQLAEEAVAENEQRRGDEGSIVEEDLTEHDDEESQRQVVQGYSRLKVVHNYEHESRLREFLRNYSARCAVVSHTFNTAGLIRLTRFAGPREDHRPPPRIRYGESLLTASELMELDSIVQSAGINMAEETYLHAKVAIADNRAMISSYNFLAAQTSAASFELREMGLLIEGTEIVDALWNRLGQQNNSLAI